jgi:hypothetical protein
MSRESASEPKGALEKGQLLITVCANDLGHQHARCQQCPENPHTQLLSFNLRHTANMTNDLSNT